MNARLLRAVLVVVFPGGACSGTEAACRENRDRTGLVNIRFGESMNPGKKGPIVVRASRLVYPPISLLQRREGEVEVKTVIGSDGSVLQAETFVSLDPTLDEAVIRGVRRSTLGLHRGTVSQSNRRSLFHAGSS